LPNEGKARFYSITKSGLNQLAKETEDWRSAGDFQERNQFGSARIGT